MHKGKIVEEGAAEAVFTIHRTPIPSAFELLRFPQDKRLTALNGAEGIRKQTKEGRHRSENKILK